MTDWGSAVTADMVGTTPEDCAARSPIGALPCMLPPGHDGPHRLSDGEGDWIWSGPVVTFDADREYDAPSREELAEAMRAELEIERWKEERA